ncbi:hypothetical protein [Paenibacillus antarcticus]|nr:hypothetical protein [Paenibacillus antarcticus]
MMCLVESASLLLMKILQSNPLLLLRQTKGGCRSVNTLLYDGSAFSELQ